jgi:LacI family transcriptional regulator
VVVFGLKYIGPSQALNGIADAAEKQNYSILMKVLYEDYGTKNVKSVIDSLISHHVDGIIWTAPEIGESHAWLKDLLDSIPVPINFLAMEPREGIPSISINNYEGAMLGVQHLLDIGRKKIVHISGPLTWWVATERKRGWRDTLEKAGMGASDHYWAEGNWAPASGKRAFLQLYEANPDMDAVFVANDQMALSVLREAHRLGIDVPKQLAVVGFDNIVESAFFCPSLTTVVQDQQLIGEMAVHTIVEMIQAAQENLPVIAQSRLISPTLIIRESSGSFA